MLPSIDGFADTDRFLAFFGMDRVAVFVADGQKKSRKSAGQPKKVFLRTGLQVSVFAFKPAFCNLATPEPVLCYSNGKESQFSTSNFL
jgi:hypothetical protein